MPAGRLLNLNQILAGVRPPVAAPHPATPATPPPAVVVAPPPAAPRPPPPGVSVTAPPAAAGELRMRPAVPGLRMNPAVLRAQIEGRGLRPRLNDLRPDLFATAPGAGFARAQSPQPISPSAAPDDRCLYEDPHNPQQRYWLPRYRLRQHGGQYEVRVALGQDGLWAVSIALETYPAEEIAEAARTAQMLPLTRQASVAYRVPGTAIEQRVPAAEIQDDPRGGCMILLRMGLAERDGLLRAFMSADAQARLLVSRAFSVAVPLPAATAPDTPKRQLMMVKGQMQFSKASVLRAGAAVRMAPGVAAPAALAPHAATPAPAGIAAARAVRIGDVMPGGGIAGGLPGGRPLPGRGRIGGIGFPPPRPRPQPQPQPQPQPEPQPQELRYQTSNQSQDWAVALFFDPQLHPYVYPAGSRNNPGASRWVVHSLRYPAGSGRSHPYFQDLSDPSRIYYLPDAFKLARRSETPHAPSLVFRVDQGDTPDDVMVDLTCEVRPVTDGERLLAARRELAAQVPASADNPQREFELRLLRASSTLQLALNRNGGVRTEAVPATIDWDNGFTFNERFEFAAFQEAVAVLMTTSNSNLLQGHVVVSSGVNENVTVPVRLNFADMEGEMFQSIETPDPQTGAVAVQLINATESKLRFQRLPTWISRGESLVEGRIDGLDLSQPIEIEPEQRVAFTVQPLAPPPGTLPADAIFDTGSVRSVPDGEAIMKYVLDDSIEQETVRPVLIETAADILLNAGQPDGEIHSIIVEFRGNRSAVLNAANLQAEVEVPVPLMDILLRRDSEGYYDYRQTVVYKSGRSAPATAWRHVDAARLFLTAV
ncbi:hypothetical protein K4L06_10030 [Lysobacter sp. BMK333-48F3]|uniref:hypothetical protein n=1 Tax=Lysobacter sp. BMK333-48F3 TaxID=2867962 RepID=UPI001C8B83DE|nr:hypothetical protein [Lysobacter sp. BMK333-48F3]MBX9401652.1 hypothetical protein [Lysobacter sp. BMK333-48F3]